jgi:hypothetical protein
MTTSESFALGGDNGKPWVDGDAEASRMIKAIHLPLDVDEHMPPDGKPQLTALEITLLKAWINSGPDFDKRLSQYDASDSIHWVVAALSAFKAETPSQKQYSFKAASSGVIERLNTPFCTVSPLYVGSPALQADFFVRNSFREASFNDLEQIAEQLVVLNMSKMPIVDDNMSLIRRFRNLEHLNLNFTDIDGHGLGELASLSELRTLSLAGTGVKAGDLLPVLKLPKLESVFLWRTSVTTAQRDSLASAYPGVSIVLSDFNDDSTLRLSRPLIDLDRVIKRGEPLELKHPMPGVNIRYSIDGTEPDTVSSHLYEKPFNFDRTTVLRARACKEGWFCSTVLEKTCFVEGLQPDTVALLVAPDPKYPGEGAGSLTDGRKGVADVLKEPSWLGYRMQSFEALAGFPSGTVIGNIVVSYGKNIVAYSFPPLEVQVWAGESVESLSQIGKYRVEQPTKYEPLTVSPISIDLEPASYRYYKIVAIPVPVLPDWHNGKGQRGWVFIDELFFY